MTFKTLTTAAATVLGLASTTFAADLNLYNWGDYINPAILAKFTEETGISVGLDTYSSNEEMLAKIQAGATGYDIIFPSVHMHDIMAKLDLLAKTDINQAADWGNIDPDFMRSVSDPDGEYCMPYAWGTVGIFYNKELSGGDITSWAEFFAIPEKTGNKITVLDDMREVLAIGLMANGKSVNTTDPADIKAAADYLVERKASISAFTYAVTGMLVSGDIAAAHFFVGLSVTTSGIDGLEYVIPSEGATMYQEDMCVLASAPNKENARKFMEFFLRPEMSALNTAQQFNGSVNIPARALVPQIISNDPNINVSAETLERLQIFTDIGATMKLYDRAWNTIRIAD